MAPAAGSDSRTCRRVLIYLLDANVFLRIAIQAAGYLQIEQKIVAAGAGALCISSVTPAELRFKS